MDYAGARRQGLPIETQDYVFFIMGKIVEEFRGAAEPAISKPPPPAVNPPSGCLAMAVDLRRATPARLLAESPFAPWGVQLSGAFSKAVALNTFARSQRRYASIIGDARPMVIGTRLRFRGSRRFYRVRVPAATRAEANDLCARIHKIGGACIVLRS